MREALTPAELDLLRAEFDVVPIVRELSGDTITPVAAFAAVSVPGEEAFLLESVDRGEILGRYSFVGFAPRRRIAFGRDFDDPVGTLRKELVPLKVWRPERLPPFFGGAIGAFGYGVARWSERLPDRHASPSDAPDALLLFFDNVIVFDHLRQKLYLVANLFTADDRSSRDLLVGAEQRIADAAERLVEVRLEPLPLLQEIPDEPFDTNMTAESFEGAVRRGKEQIAAGEIYQIVLSQRWETGFPESEALTLYRILRSANPSPYMFLLRMNECTLVGSSPEMLVREASGQAELRPIAGTRPRGATHDEDSRLERELLADPKENAEHLMLVDLGRNDLGRVCESGSVSVTEFSHVERYSHVMHIVSGVKGMLRKDRTPVDLFLSAFPAGTVSGAPKIRAMELIDELEPTRRGFYAGAVAYIGFGGSLDSCIAIRTIELRGGRAYVQAGAGIVFDSDPAREYEETASKSAALRRTISAAKAILSTRLMEARP